MLLAFFFIKVQENHPRRMSMVSDVHTFGLTSYTKVNIRKEIRFLTKQKVARKTLESTGAVVLILYYLT